MRYKWNEQKNQELKSVRGFGFDDILPILEKGEIISIFKHQNSKKYPNQYILILIFEGYACEVPFVFEDETTIFLKTIFKSRKANKSFNI